MLAVDGVAARLGSCASRPSERECDTGLMARNLLEEDNFTLCREEPRLGTYRLDLGPYSKIAD